MTDRDQLEYPEVLQELRGSMNLGRLKLQSDKIIFRNSKTGRTEHISSTDIENINWLLRAKGHCLKISTKTGSIHRFDGFKDVDFDQLSNFVKKFYKTGLEKIDMCLKGWNWGNTRFEGNNVQFNVDNKPCFEVPLNYVSHTTAGKNEVTLEFHLNDDADVALTEMRFHIPSEANAERDPVEEFHKSVLNKADIIQVTGNVLTTFDQVHCLTPRGKYDIKLFHTFLQLHGKTFDYKIPYNTILRLFLLPHRDGRQMYFVISLDPPIKQGQTRYHFLIFAFQKDNETTLELSMKQEQLDEKYKGKNLKETMSGYEYEVISRLMKALTGQKITVPGSFKGPSGLQSLACSYKASTGFLYPLEKGFIFIHKPPIYIRFDEVSTVNFARSAGGSLTRSFDFEVETKTGNQFTFVGVDKDEYGKLFEFVRNSKKLRVKNTGNQMNEAADGMSSSDEEHDAYLERMKQEAKERDEEDEEDDEDFVAPESGSDVAEEYDTDAQSSSEEGEEGEAAEKKSKPKTVTIKEPGFGKKEKREKQEKKSKKKAGKDPNAPKRPATAYFLWLNTMRETIKEENPGLSVTEVAKKAGELWRGLADKSEWEEKHKELKAEYEVAMAEYRKNPGSAVGSTASSSKSPKKSVSSPVKGGSGAGFISKEFISDSDSSDDEKAKKKDDSKPRASRRGRGGSESDPGELPSEEEILSEPEASEPSASGSDDE